MKTCSKCKTTKDYSAFRSRGDGKGRDGFRSWCSECLNEKDRAESKSPKARERNRNGQRKRREWFDSLKVGSCVDCGISYPPRVMDWHHIRPKQISLRPGSYSKQRILEEIERCILLCANCHRLRHS